MELEVTGMHCGGCVRTVERVVGRVPGVKTVKVTLEGGRVEVEGDAAREAVVEAIRKAGYEVTGAA